MAEQNDNLACGNYYEIRLKGHLKPDWSEWLDGLAIVPLENGETLLSGHLPDQAALHGVLAKIRDLNLTLISLSRIETGEMRK